ncbi:Dephospho-CoA kinase [Candidatus Zixiibacteriota bacterium]|nr:Dephospho-CoA kinase [candidate division Zixibacteria bacterium]
MLIGITGQIGSGKTEVARLFRKHRAFVISADKIGHDVVDNDPKVLGKLVAAFGQGIINSRGRLNRKQLAQIAFSSTRGKAKLDSIVHPPLLKELSRQVRNAQIRNKLVVVDAALLIEWGWHKKVDYLLVVLAPNRAKIARLMNKGYSQREAHSRLKSQLSARRYRQVADRVIYNNKSLAALEVQVKEIISALTKKG